MQTKSTLLISAFLAIAFSTTNLLAKPSSSRCCAVTTEAIHLQLKCEGSASDISIKIDDDGKNIKLTVKITATLKCLGNTVSDTQTITFETTRDQLTDCIDVSVKKKIIKVKGKLCLRGKAV